MIDVAIPYHPKDGYTIDACIDSIKKHFKECGQIYIISKDEFVHDDVKWIPEANYSFSKQTIADSIKVNNPAIPNKSVGWVYQQLLKVCVQYAEPNISDTYMIIDSDIIFVKDYSVFEVEDGVTKIAHNYSFRYNEPYITNMKRINPRFQEFKQIEKGTGVNHMMVYEKEKVESMISIITRDGAEELWDAVISRVKDSLNGGFLCIDYEIYWNYVLTTYPQDYVLRRSRWEDFTDYKPILDNPDHPVHKSNVVYIGNHSWTRDPVTQKEPWFRPPWVWEP